MAAERSHPVFLQPHDENVPVWRFMDFAKFAHLLFTSSIYFARADRLGDPFEGVLPPQTLRALEPSLRRIYLEGGNAPANVQQILHGGPDFPGLGMLEHTKRMYKLQREWTYVSCWHANPAESAAMWRLYTQSQDAIAIRSTYARLGNALPSEAILGVVQYVDFDDARVDFTNLFLPFVIKRKSFEHEREVRAVMQEVPLVSIDGEKAALLTGTKAPHGRDSSDKWHIEWRPNEKAGMGVSIEPTALIEEVYVAPSATDWFLELVRHMVDKSGVGAPVRRSSLESQPVW